jgi:hypothetical protein
MGNSVKSFRKLVDECSDTNRDEWPDEARTVLEAVRRISKPTKAKVRRTIAEAILKKIVIPSIVDSGWTLRSAKAGDPSCDVLLERDSLVARVEMVLLQPATAKFKRIHRGQHSENTYALEMQKKQIRSKAAKSITIGEARRTNCAASANGRSYRFGEFDILAVNIHAATYRWTDFRYTLSNRLCPNPSHKSLIDTVQLVSLKPNDLWTDDLSTCLKWLSKASQSATGTR